MMKINDDETLDDLLIGDLKIVQARNGYRFSIDPILLCAFAKINPEGRVADLGTGCGVMPLILAKSGKGREIVGFERQPAMVARARRSVALNGLEAKIIIQQADVRELLDSVTAGSFDSVICNPPYRISGSGRASSNPERAAARHELAGDLADFIKAARWLLKTGAGFSVILWANRLAELTDQMRCCRLEPKRLRMVHPRIDEPASMVMVEGVKNGAPGLVVEAPLIVYKGQGRDYTEEVLAMYAGKGARNA